MDNHEYSHAETLELEIEEQFLNTKAEFSSSAEAVKCMKHELESIASKYNYTIDELLEKAEASQFDNDDYHNALSLDKRITFFTYEIPISK